MIKISGNDVWRNGEKIGWIEENHIMSHDGQRLGYFSSNDIFKESGIKIGYVQGNNLIVANGNDISLEKLRSRVQGSATDLERAAIYMFFGE